MDSGVCIASTGRKLNDEQKAALYEKTKNIDSSIVFASVSHAGLKDPLITAILCVFLGVLGVHRFYIGDYKIGVIFPVAAILSISAMIISFFFTASIFFVLLPVVVLIAALIDTYFSYRRTLKINFNRINYVLDNVGLGDNAAD